MTGRRAYPPVDDRRARALRATLLRDMSALAPEWRGATEDTGPDRALVDIAARLLEQSTRRLDQTPERDGLAFLELLSIPTPRPRSAEGFAVVALADDRTAPEVIPQGSGFDLEADGEKIRFETADALTIHATRIATVTTVSPQTDEIGRAPPQVFALDGEAGDVLNYPLVASVGPEDRFLRLGFTTGLEEGNLLLCQPEGATPQIKTIETLSDDGLVTLAEPIGAVLQVGATDIHRMTWLEAFEMPDRQEHALYIGDSAALEVSEAAEITLTIEGTFLDGRTAAEAFAETPVDVEIWGQPDADPEAPPGWQRLPLIERDSSAFTFLKAWTGPVLEVEIAPERKSRWLRLRRVRPIVPLPDGADTTVLSFDKLTLNVEVLPPQTPEASVGVTQAAHNATPLPVTSAFLPFGSEPQRFDAFALAAPEVFTKAGATATLEFDLQDSTLLTINPVLTVASNVRRHLYGIAQNGRMQVIDRSSPAQYWLELGGPLSEDGTGEAPVLDVDFGVRAVHPSPPHTDWDLTLVAATDGDGLALQTGSVRVSPGVLAGDFNSNGDGPWRKMPALGDMNPVEGRAGIVLAPMMRSNSHAIIYWAHAGGISQLRLKLNGALWSDATWETLVPTGPAPSLDEAVRLVPIEGSMVGGTGSFLVSDDAGILWRLDVDDAGGASWHGISDGLSEPLGVIGGVAPVARQWRSVEGVASRFSVLTRQASDGRLRYVERNTFGVVSDEELVPDDGSAAFFQLIPGIDPQNTDDFPPFDVPSIVAIYNRLGATEVLEWSRGAWTTPFVHRLGRVARDHLAFGGTAGDLPEITLALDAQSIAHIRLRASTLAEFRTWMRAELTNDQTNRAVIEHSADGVVVGPGDLDSFREPGGGNFRSLALPKGEHASRGDPIRLWLWETLRNGGFDHVTMTITLTEGALPSIGEMVFVAREGTDQFRRFIVADTDGPTDTFVIAEAVAGSADALIGEAAVDFRLSTTGPEVLVGPTSETNVGTLAVFTGVGALPSAFVTPGLNGATIPVPGPEVPFDNDTVVLTVLSPWTGAVPPDSIVKILMPGQPAQEFVVEPLDLNYQGPELSWEYYNGQGWKRLTVGDADTTLNLARSGRISFLIPADLSTVAIGGQEDLWVRARLVGGDYGRPRYEVTSVEEDDTTTQSISVLTGHMRPPEVSKLIASFADMPPRAPSALVARNNLRDIDQSSANRLNGVPFTVFQGAHVAPLGTEGNAPAIYIGLTKPILPGRATLFVKAEDRAGQADIKIETLGAELNWSEAPLGADEPTGGFLQSGLIGFTVEAPMAKAAFFGTAQYWLRVTGPDGWLPKIEGMWLNAVPIAQAETIRQELLGTSLGEQGTEFTLQKGPVLEDTLELRVRERLSAEEVDALRAAGGPEAVLDDVPNIRGQWVRWDQVLSFDRLGPARAYLLTADRTVLFGSGDEGRIPPAIRDGIRAFSYQVGGQPVTAPALTALKLLAPPPGLEASFAPESIAGGSKAPTAEERLAQMPEALRHQNAPLSLADLEALARNFDTDIAQVRAFQGSAPGTPIELFVLARGKSRAHVYSKVKRATLARVLSAEMSDAFAPTCLTVHTAGFAHRQVKVSVRPAKGRAGAVNRAVRERLDQFLHPACGGPDGEGWPLGRALWPLDIDRALRDIDGLEAVAAIEISGNEHPPAKGAAIMTRAPEDIIVSIEGDAP